MGGLQIAEELGCIGVDDAMSVAARLAEVGAGAAGDQVGDIGRQ
jgi:hypothetical protein